MVNIAKTKERIFYKDHVVLEKDSVGVDQFYVFQDGLYEITVIGAGAGGAFNSSSNRSSAAAGGSASGAKVLMVLKGNPGSMLGRIFGVSVGKGGEVTGGLDMNVVGGPGGDTWVKVGGEEILVAPGGIGGHVWWPNSAEAGAPAPLPTVATENPNIEFKKWIFSKQGIPGAIMGNPSAGGPSVLDGTTYGQGGQAWKAGGSSRGEVGKDGYIKVVYKEPVKGPENLNALTHSDLSISMAAGEIINIPDGKDGDVNKFLAVTSVNDTSYLGSISASGVYYVCLNEIGGIFVDAVENFYYQEEPPTTPRNPTYWFKPSEHIWRVSNNPTEFDWQPKIMGIIGRAWENQSTGEISDVHYEPYGEWDDYEDVTKSYVVKTKKRTYRKKFILPVLTENGVMGGETFAVDCSTPKDNVYEIFNAGADGTEAVDTNPNAAPQWVRFYNPIPLKVTKFRLGQIKNTAEQNNYYITAWKVQASDDNETWTDVYSGTGSKPATTLTANIEDSGYHKYYRAYVVSAQYYSGHPRVFFYGIDFDAEAEDAVFYDEEIESYAAKRKIRRYYKNTELFDANIINSATSAIGTVSYSGAAVYQSNAWDCFGYTRIGFKTNTAKGSGQSEITFNEVQPAGFYTFKADNTQNGTATFSVTFNDGTTQTLAQVTADSTKVPVAETRIYLSKPVVKAKVAFTSSNWGLSGGWSFAKGEEVSASDDYDYYVDTDL